MDSTASKETDTRPEQGGPGETQEPSPAGGSPAPAAEPSADDQPQLHGITDELARLFLKNFLPAGAQFALKSFQYRPIASLGEGYTTVRKVLEVAYRDEKTGADDTAVLVVKVPSECDRRTRSRSWGADAGHEPADLRVTVRAGIRVKLH